MFFVTYIQYSDPIHGTNTDGCTRFKPCNVSITDLCNIMNTIPVSECKYRIIKPVQLNLRPPTLLVIVVTLLIELDTSWYSACYTQCYIT